MLLLLGASGYVGHAFANELLRRRQPFIPLTRRAIDYSDFNLLFHYLRKIRPSFLINAAGYTGNPDEEGCEAAREETLSANTLLPQTIARACLVTNTPWGHVSSGSVFAGAKIVEHGRVHVETNLHRPEVRQLLADHPEQIVGFSETDEANSSFRHTPCSFYGGSKALAEEAVRDMGQCYVWRPGVPFNDCEEPRNFLCRIQHADKLCDSVNSFSHVDDFVCACLALWEQKAPVGTYNVVNPGALSTRQVIDLIQRILKLNRRFEFWSDNECGQFAHSHCVLDASKILNACVEMRPVAEAFEDALRHWQPAVSSRELIFH